MKIIGMMLTWNNLYFFRCALTQALKFCDEVIVVEGCHLKEYSKRSTDGTCEYLKTLSHPKLTIIEDFDFEGSCSQIQCQIRKTYGRQSEYWRPGNWVINWDDDTFFFDKDLKIIKQAMETDGIDILKPMERRFAFNFKFNLLAHADGIYSAVFQKIKEGCYYILPSKLCNKDGSLYSNILELPDIIYHHYPYVKLTERSKFRWALSVAKGEISNKKTGELWDNFSWDKDEDIFKHEKIFRKIIGGRGELNIYYGEHPEVLNLHPWRLLDDIRILG